MKIISRSAWGARQPKGGIPTVQWASRTGFVVHYSAASPSQTPRIIQDFHMDTRGWQDIGYNFLVDASGRIYEGRGWTAQGAHVGGHNTANLGVCFIGRDEKDKIDASPEVRRAIRWLYDEACRRAGRKLTRRGHRDLAATTCPGDELYRWVHAGMPVDEPATPAPKPKPPAKSPAPGPAVAFPLPKGHYFGPASGPDRSVSGHHGRRFGGRLDRDWLKGWADQLARRGWSIGKGKRHLGRHGNDGRYGDEYRALIEAFQRDQGLAVDGLLGPDTWTAAYRNPVT
ncbi:peptidoglycan recognition protein family protein [Micromonospora yangpuensis]|uniref:Putative peptidoglycan binding domain-containing protein n=1 Tax=Micromonospora yangpuensis TaxID=683228 RepID=A0A1C6VEF1_9ACTN|nr:N-acetylmuramoyl-L-alanine amidase [Micromonospora yangpuensis]GGM14388.1 hypothetical protein GCM10012279_35610 [Micromonospora yangpuensis]SCL64625.1 Putative peptidoglycan binding domain-containing protein [Micromonospora yangpuensis]